jgi:hypothetical protein
MENGMANVDGEWACSLKTPMGAQETVLTVTTDGAGGFTGTNSGAQGCVDVRDGKVNGDTLTWKMDVKTPVVMILDANATIAGDTLTGTVKLGMFGTAPMTGTRKT